MRILFTVSPGTTTFNAMVPMAWALRTAGHDVRVASQPLFADEITQAGLTAVPVGRSLGIPRLLLAMGLDSATVEETRAGFPPPYNIWEESAGARWEDTLPAFGAVVDGAKYETFAIATALVEFARSWEPDLVVWEPLTPVGAIAAKACGAAHARLLYGIDAFGLARQKFLAMKNEQPEPEQGDPVADWLGGYARKYGGEYSEDMAVGHFTIDQIPASLQTEADLHYLRTPYIPYGGRAVVPGWLQRRPERPRVALTMGLSATGYFSGYTVNVRDILDALSDLDVEVVATVAEEEQSALDPLPDNARVVSFVPLHVLAPTCSVAITHAGFGTLTSFAPHGVPQLTLPYHFDEPMLGRKLAEQGAGLYLDPTEATGEAVREGVVRLLEDRELRGGAARLAGEIAELPTPNELVPRIEELTRKHCAR
ncbi:activator-dependent family glycosyltransferase [Amycolatopsis suaedae]|uniref:Activator-dependent family glycosyltransferase n=1 Tax=Amycolatopsis suaedae TaxID=2510978 RepID=A0A4V2ELD3_9PSEU|nr:activator-dependent family glycosyltransferase [Amycolatopsis suaedae]RZQ61165.1 activator-dependent family glycosyltransferase [Amycolatopsis suaedae]